MPRVFLFTTRPKYFLPFTTLDLLELIATAWDCHKRKCFYSLSLAMSSCVLDRDLRLRLAGDSVVLFAIDLGLLRMLG